MKHLKSIQTLVYAIALVLVTACSPTTPITVAPNVTFKTLTGKQFDTASLKGQVTLVNFWATNCSTCVKEMPMLSSLYNNYAPKGYRTVAVAMDYDTPAFISNFVESRKLPFEVVHDSTGAIAKAFNNTKLTPTSYLINKQGDIVKRYVGEPKEADLKAAIEALL